MLPPALAVNGSIVSISQKDGRCATEGCRFQNRLGTMVSSAYAYPMPKS
jgi:hypothetical protein